MGCRRSFERAGSRTPLNVLWAVGAVCGLVDRIDACNGDPHAELGHCRWNFHVLLGGDVAERFLGTRLRFDDRGPSDAWWDLATAVGLLPGPIRTSGWHAVGRIELTDDRVIDATASFVRAVLDR